MSGLRPPAKTVKVTAEMCRPWLVTGVRILTSVFILSFENVRNCCILISHIHLA